MERFRKAKRISWAPDPNLCQVRLFRSEDCPSKVGLNIQDHHQIKASWISNSNAMESHDLPPGFEGSHVVKGFNKKRCHIPKIKWKCPSKFGIDSNWFVAAGEESTEAVAQKIRESRVLEAIYPRLTNIPSCPSNSSDIQYEHYDDSLTPLVSLTPIEEEEEEEEGEIGDKMSDLAIPLDTPINSQPAAISRGLFSSGNPTSSKYNNPVLEPPANEKPASPSMNRDMVVAASAALSAIMKSNEKGSLIDTELLIKILSDQKKIEQLSKVLGSLVKTEQETSRMVTKPMFGLKQETHNVVTKPVFGLKQDTDNVVTKPVVVQKLETLNIVTKPVFGLKPQTPSMVTKPVSGLKQETQPVPIISQTPDDIFSSMPANGTSPHLSNAMLPPDPNFLLLQPSTTWVTPFPLSGQENNMVSPPELANGNLFCLPHPMQILPNVTRSQHKPVPTPPPPMITMQASQPVKDINYYKNLIRQHGGETQETGDRIISQNGNHNNLQKLKLAHNLSANDTNPKKKRCKFFKRKKGCRDGSNCPFRHEEKQDVGILETTKLV